MAGEVTIINTLLRKDQVAGGPVLPIAASEQISILIPINHWAVGYPPYELNEVHEAIEYLGTLLVATVKGGGSTPTIPTTYTATKSFTASCGSGLVGNPVTKTATRTSTVSQADADTQATNAATTQAQGALVCTTPVTTYQAVSQSYTTTSGDYTTKCGSGSGTPVTRTSTTGTSTISQADANSKALADAKSQAIAAIVCQVTTYSSTQSYTATCGSGTTGSPVTRSSTKTSTVSQAQADSLALQDATSQANAALVCTPVPVTYNKTLPDPNTGVQTGDGMSVVPPTTETLNYDEITGTSGPTISIAITSLGATTYIDYASEYGGNPGKPYVFTNSAGTKFSGTFPSSDNLSITY